MDFRDSNASWLLHKTGLFMMAHTVSMSFGVEAAQMLIRASVTSLRKQ